MNIIKKLGTRLYDANGHIGYLVEVELVTQLVSKWSKNRESDKQRVIEISQHIKEKKWVPMTIYTANLPIEGLVCYDGNHRREAFKQISPLMNKALVIIDILKDPSDIYAAFQCINKSVPISLIDSMVDHDTLKTKQDIELLVKHYEMHFHTFISTSPRCNTPHFNRDNFKDQLYRLLCGHGLVKNKVTLSDLKNALEILNDAYKKDTRAGSEHSRLRERVLEKCKNDGLWLFAFRREISDVDIMWALHVCETRAAALRSVDLLMD